MIKILTKKLILLFSGMAFCLVAVHPLQGQIRAGASFLKIIPGAREQGLGGSLTGTLDVTQALYANPGALGFLREWQWSASYTRWIADIYNVSLLYARKMRWHTPLSREWSLALGLNYQGIREFDSSRGAAPPASARDFLATLSLATPLEFISRNLSFGTSVKYLNSTLDQVSAHAWSVDFGLQFRTPRLKLRTLGLGIFDYGILSGGVAITHLGTEMKFLNQTTPLPTTFRTGMALNLGRHDGLQLQVAADYLKVRDESARFNFGAELSNVLSPLSHGLGRFVAVRGGYNYDNNLLSKLSLGLSIRLDDYMEAPLKEIVPENTALQVDIGVIESSEFFDPVYRGSLTHFPILPEKFELFKPQLGYGPDSSAILLSWQATRDPDLYDDVDYILLLMPQDSLALDQFLQKVKKQEVNLFRNLPSNSKELDFASVNFLSLYVLHDTLNDGLNHFQLAYDVNLIIKIDSTYQVNKKSKIVKHILKPPIQPGHYYWSVVAFDRNRHVRFGERESKIIDHFFVPSKKPDLTIKIEMEEQIKEPPPPKIVLENVTFAPDSFQINDQAKKILLTWVDFLKKYPEAIFEIAGHTDNTGPSPEKKRIKYNLELSLKRANSIKEFLIAHGIFPDCLRVRGYGESQPLDPRNTPQARAKNRRVEIRLVDYPRVPQKIWVAKIIYGNKLHPARNFSLRVFGTPQIQTDVNSLLTSKVPMVETLKQDSLSWQLQPIFEKWINKMPENYQDTLEIVLDKNWGTLIAEIDDENRVEEKDELNNLDIVFLPYYDLALNQEVNEYIVQGGDTVKYKINVKNNGPAKAQNIKIYNVLHDSLTIFHFSLPPTKVYGDTILWEIEELPADSSMTINFLAKIGEIPLDTTVFILNKSFLVAARDIEYKNNYDATTIYSSLITFEFNSYKLTQKAKAVLKEMAIAMNKKPQIIFEIAGHASFEPFVSPARMPLQYCANLRISQKRAESVRQFLIKQGVSPDRLIARGYSHLLPKYDNNTREGRKKNRRVEIKPYRPMNIKLEKCN